MFNAAIIALSDWVAAGQSQFDAQTTWAKAGLKEVNTDATVMSGLMRKAESSI